MSIEGSTTNHMLSRGGASIAPSTYISFHVAVPLLWRAIAKHVAKFVSISKLLFGSLTVTHCCLKMPWLCAGDVMHSQSLTLTSDDLIWSSCGDYYDRTSIVMKIIQKASELWTAITGHESQHSQGNTWTWSQVITHCDLSLNIMLGSKQHLTNGQQIILLLLYCDSFMTFKNTFFQSWLHIFLQKIIL